MRRPAILVVATLGLCAAAPPQGSAGRGDAKQIIRKIKEEMQLIDKLLNQASTKVGGKSSSASSGRSGEVKTLLESSIEQSRSVVDKIDKLLELARQRGRGGRPSGSGGNRGGQRNEGRQQRRPDDRLQESPDLVEREGRRKGGRQDPHGPQPDTDRGKQQRGADRSYPPGKKNPKELEQGGWGDLPPYLQMLFKKGGRPKLPAKYRRFRDEFHKRADQKKK